MPTPGKPSRRKRPRTAKATADTASVEASRIDALRALALDLHFSWNHASDELWARLAPELWAATHNPHAVLQTVSPRQIESLLTDSAWRRRVDDLVEERRRHMAAPSWFAEHHADAALAGVAYFSMEFALSEALPIYSGGLGNVAADQLKAACDLDVPVLGVGLLYQQGYFRQAISADGRQEALFPYNDPGQLPVVPLRDAGGEWVRVRLSLPGHDLWLRAWQVRVDRRLLYLLDSNDPANRPAARGITAELYGGGPAQRLQQEIALGIGGWRLLRGVGVELDVCHLNEGHAAFAVLERARGFMEDHQCSFAVALTATRAGNLFTTHTAVPAGFDRFDAALLAQYLRGYAERELRIPFEELLALGRANAHDGGEPFNMAHLALRGSGAVNGVSRLHGVVSRRLFQPLFPRWPEHDVPVGHVTNGIHVPTWDSVASDALWTAACGKDRWRHTMETIDADVRRIADEELWSTRTANRTALVEYVRARMPRELAATGAGAVRAAAAREWLDPQALTLGFARRFATYKRATLLLHSPDRLVRLLSDRERPVQIVIAGKAHPADVAGQDMLAEWLRFIERPDVQGRVVFIPDYDLLLAEELVQGVDLWLNTPRRPWEASGTSGMKVLVNGGLNLSELDGWWAEAYTPDTGWAIGDGRQHGDDPAWDAVEAEELYTLLEREVAPAFYAREARGVPTAWVAKMRESMATLTPQFSTNRVVREYTERFYLPASRAYRRRAANDGALAAQLSAWQRKIAEHWAMARFGALRVETRDGEHRFVVDVELGGLSFDDVVVELYADGVDGDEPQRHAMVAHDAPIGPGTLRAYEQTVPASRPAGDYTPRLVARHADLQVPLEVPEILWQR